MQSAVFLPNTACDGLCRLCKVFKFYLCQAVTTCVGYVGCYILSMPAVKTCTGYTEGYIFFPTPAEAGVLSVVFSTYASCALCRLCRVLYFYLTVGIDRKITLVHPGQLA